MDTISNPSALGEWRPNSKKPLRFPESSLKRKAFSCKVPLLYPTHPSQILKEYHRDDKAVYQRNKIDGVSDECLRSPYKNPSKSQRKRVEKMLQHHKKRGKVPVCSTPDSARHAVLSDTYIDVCGNYYRGVAEFRYQYSDESMGHGVSLGRTFYLISPPEKGGAEGYVAPENAIKGPKNAGSYGPGHTYAVSVSQFKFLAELLPGDMAKIRSERSGAIGETHSLAEDKLIFNLK